MPQNDRDISVAGPPPTEPATGDGAEPTGPAKVFGEEPAAPPAPEIEAPPLERVSRSYLAWIMIASFGASLALMVPLSYSLAVRIDDLVPGREELLGYVTGSAQFVYLVLSPLIGFWSDRMRSRLGRRTPFMFAGTAIGMVGLLGIAVAPTVFLVGLAWVVGMVGWSTVGQAIQNVQADRVPEEQRGRVSAVTSVMTQIAPVVGIGIAYTVASSTLLVFLVPGVIGSVMLLLFPLLKPEGDSRALVHTSEVSLKGLVASYGFNPRKYPDFGWNWLGRFVFFMGLYFNTTFGTFFYAQRLDMPVKEVAGVVAAIGIIGVLAAAGGAIGGGFLSDKLGRRKLFTMIGSTIFVAGAVAEAFAHSLPQLIVGAVLMQLAIAMFSAVDQAIVFAILPDRAQAGRYLAVVAFAQKIPSAIAPLIAPLIITIGVTGSDKNYTYLYLSGAVLALVGGLIIKFGVKSVR
ncbi:MFS transporter [Streptomyces sp. PSKA54]|uniref:MFS transporter n=1 Tax=Streptomyces himalayensis subsp. aureolus TaxID=2758039 RepID=A0A7W2D1L3_9ACTN|nr:MFS transporter [Streptomyces himalayensis]MBA4863016.1 MFS transporter [Streptomyces himalayensis subsp. aureolus]